VLGVLLALVEKCGQLVTKDELMNRVWPSTFVGENNLPVCIYKRGRFWERVETGMLTSRL
jgi:DNA-binding winged helix-turn-helix (wHTH) protein